LLRLPFEYRIRGASGPRVPAPLPSAHDRRTPVSPLRVLSEPATRRVSTLSAPPWRACRGTCVLAQCASRGRVCEHRARAPFEHRARTVARVQHALEYPCPVPSRTKTHAAIACCAGVSARHGPVHTHFTAQRDEPCPPQGFLLELARRHDPRRAVGAQAAYNSVRAPRARCRAVRVRASACPLVSVSTPARLHASSHCRTRTLAARGREHAGSSPRQWPSAVGYSVSFAVPPRVLVKTHAAAACCAGASARHGPVHKHFTAQRDEPCTPQGFRQ
jgi:hypothetical protein